MERSPVTPYLLEGESVCSLCTRIVRDQVRHPDCDNVQCMREKPEVSSCVDPCSRGKKEIELRESGVLGEITPAPEFGPLL